MLTRIVSGIVGIIAAACIIQAGGMVFAAAVVVLGCIAWREYMKAFAHKNVQLPSFLGFFMVVFIILSADQSQNLMLPLIAAVFLSMIQMVFRHKSFSVEAACITLAGVIYIGVPFYHLLALRLLEDYRLIMPGTPVGDISMGCALIWLTFIGTWASDTFAYFIGSSMGRHRLCPDISPKKSIEGFIGGIIGTMLCMGALGAWLGFSLPVMLVLGAAVAVIGTLGDLVESCFKRYVGIKDSGTLIPGHGGVLDRFDSMMFTAPLVYYTAVFLLIK